MSPSLKKIITPLVVAFAAVLLANLFYTFYAQGRFYEFFGGEQVKIARDMSCVIACAASSIIGAIAAIIARIKAKEADRKWKIVSLAALALNLAPFATALIFIVRKAL